MKKIIKYPFYRDTGVLLQFYHTDRDNDIVEFKDNFEFEDTLKYVGYSKGRSSIVMSFQSLTNDRIYPMFLSVFDKLVRFGDNRYFPVVKGKWTFCKQGKNFSIKPVVERNNDV